jgi:hypothetical protein
MQSATWRNFSTLLHPIVNEMVIDKLGKICLVSKMPYSTFYPHCGTSLEADSEFCPKCGKTITVVSTPTPSQVTPPTSPTGPTQSQTQSGKIWGIDKRFLIVAVIVLVILIVPVFPRDTVVMVNGTTQTIVNSASISTEVQVSTVSTSSQMSVYTGSFQHFTTMYPHWGSQWYGSSYCYYGYYGHLHCNYNYWPWYYQWRSYSSTVTVTPQMQVVNVISSVGYNGLETVTLVYSNGQQSRTYRNVYNDQLQPGGTYSVPSTGTVTNTITNTVTVPVQETIPCTACVTTHVTEYVSLLQLIFGF